MLSRLRVGVRGCGEEDRVCSKAIGRGNAIVAMSKHTAVEAKAVATPAKLQDVFSHNMRSWKRSRT